ncbi:MAG TPA: asparagine synthase C-terminal domain-containing protein [Propionibacteriaceae bacterium]|nr:asparagine synthase C-terminal domain-containing protein [Propionibacteriaceae bacterium]
MSHEILLIAGRSEALPRARRLAMLDHAARAVPGFASWSVVESPAASAALVVTSPVGGSFAQLTRTAGGGRITVATTRRGLALREGESALHGAEAGHVRVFLGPDDSVVVDTDGVGFLPAFWGVDDHTLFVSTHLASLVSLGLPGDVDDRGLIEYLTMLHPMQERTLLQAASLLSAGSSLKWRDVTADITRRPLFVPSADSLSDDDVVAAFAEIWPDVIGDAVGGPDRMTLGLSGGLDSRAIAEMAVGLGHRPVTYTYGAADTREAAVAARVAGVLGLPHLNVPISDDRLLANSHATLPLLDGAHSASEMYELWFADLLRSSTDVVVNGLAGGPLWGDDKAVGLTDPAAVLDRQWKRYASEVLTITPFLSADLREGAEDVIRRSLAESLGAWDLAARPDMVIFWKIANRQLRWGNMLTTALRRAGLRTEAPFLDSRFLTLAARLTPDQRRNGRLYLRVHREVFPSTAGLGRSDDGNAPRWLDHVYWSGESSFVHQLGVLASHHPISGIRRGWRLGTQVAFSRLRSQFSVSGPADHEDARRAVFPSDVWLRTRRPYAERLIDLLEAGQGCSLISTDAVSQAVDGIRSGNPTVPALTLGKVAAAQIWLGDYKRRATSLPGS